MIYNDFYDALKNAKKNYGVKTIRKILFSYKLIKLFNRDNKNVKIIGFSINELNISHDNHNSIYGFIGNNYPKSIAFAISFSDRSRERCAGRYINSFEAENSMFILNNLINTKSFWYCLVDETNAFKSCGNISSFLNNNNELYNLEKCCLEVSSILKKK